MGDTSVSDRSESISEKLIALTRNADQNVDTSDPVDYWHRLGQPNAYAEDAGNVIGCGVDNLAFAISDRITVALSDGCANVPELEHRALGHHHVELAPDPTASALKWVGPVAFARAYGAVPGIDHDFGTQWVPNGDERVSLRVEVGCDAGLLYVYDPTWDEYAVIGTDVPLAAVQDTFARALQLGENAAVEDFIALPPHVSAVRPSPGPEL